MQTCENLSKIILKNLTLWQYIEDYGCHRLRKLSNRLDQLRNGFLEQSVAKYKKTIPTVVDELRSGVVLKLVFILLTLGTLTFLYTEIGRAFGLPTPYSLLTAWLDGHALPRLIASLDGCSIRR